MKIFGAWKKLREFERTRLPFLGSIIDFDIVIDIGFAEEMGHPLTLKQLLLLIPASRTTVRRRLARLIKEGVVLAKRNGSDRRSVHLSISPSSLKVFTKYANTITSAFGVPAA
jgi:DNA-binding MarR family transcriptional regulator